MTDDGEILLKNNHLNDFCTFVSFTPMIGVNKESPPIPITKDRQIISRDDKNGDQVQTQQQQHHHLYQQQQQLQQQQYQISQPQPAQQQMLGSDLLNSLPVWDRNLAPGARVGRSSSETSPNAETSYTMAPNVIGGSVESPNPSEVSGPRTTESSPVSGVSTGSRPSCSWCEINAIVRCLDCKEDMCNDCMHIHPRNSSHRMVRISNILSPNLHMTHCETHMEVYRFVCEQCKTLICQYCTFRDHRDHNYVQLSLYADGAMKKIEAALESSSLGTKCVKGSIDKALSYTRTTEREAGELSQSIRKSFRQLILAVEERERQLVDQIERFSQRKQTQLADQTAGLRSALAGLSQNSEMLLKAAENLTQVDILEIAQAITKGQRQLEQFAAIYQNLQPKLEFFGYVPPSFSIIHDIRNQGELIFSDSKLCTSNGFVSAAVGSGRRPLVRDSSQSSTPIPATAVASTARSPFEANLPFGVGIPPMIGAAPIAQHASTIGPNARIGHCIPGSYEKVIVRKSLIPTTAFACDGHEDGQVSRPWGVCVDKEGNILISDRRNNRVQVFYPDGTYKFKFGTKGVGNGQFDLPAGICVDCDNRIIVVDKDNHRVQIFTSQGRFLLKFGCYGREYGQFQYPWDVAVNSRRQIVVTDSRNHRIQQFDSEGRFIKHFVFDNFNHSKGPASPRGVCFTPAGDLIVSDFDNHCLLLIDSDLQQVLSAKGHEGTGIQEFNRPSGICCDDDGNIVIADSKNQRVIVFTETLEYLWTIEIRPSLNPHFPSTLDEKDRPCDVALLPDGRIVIMVELSPDARDSSNPLKKFVQVY